MFTRTQGEIMHKNLFLFVAGAILLGLPVDTDALPPPIYAYDIPDDEIIPYSAHHGKSGVYYMPAPIGLLSYHGARLVPPDFGDGRISSAALASLEG